MRYKITEWFGYKPPIGRDQTVKETEDAHMNRIASDGWKCVAVLVVTMPFAGKQFYWEKP